MALSYSGHEACGLGQVDDGVDGSSDYLSLYGCDWHNIGACGEFHVLPASERVATAPDLFFELGPAPKSLG